ncbi:hypothetical protein M569_01167, partial [Genlisea aurea]
RTPPWPDFPTSKSDADCMERLLTYCAAAIESNEATLAQQILWVLNNIAPADGDSNQRLAWGFLRALISRAVKSGNSKLLTAVADVLGDGVEAAIRRNHRFSIMELAGFVDLTPWHRFGFTAANAAVIEAVEGYPVIHIVDLSSTHCMQIPTLIDDIATRMAHSPPSLIKLTVAARTGGEIPPLRDFSYDELGWKLTNFARIRNLTLEFRPVPCTHSDGFSSLIHRLQIQPRDHRREALVLNCHMTLHCIPECLRDAFLRSARSLNPRAVVVVEEDVDLSSADLVQRVRSAYNYLWIQYDSMETVVWRQREWVEAEIWWKIENVVAQEGWGRVERAEAKGRWVQRMRKAGYGSVRFGEATVEEVKGMLEEHAAGWGLKREEENEEQGIHHLVLTWKGHNVLFASAWAP